MRRSSLVALWAAVFAFILPTSAYGSAQAVTLSTAAGDSCTWYFDVYGVNTSATNVNVTSFGSWDCTAPISLFGHVELYKAVLPDVWQHLGDSPGWGCFCASVSDSVTSNDARKRLYRGKMVAGAILNSDKDYWVPTDPSTAAFCTGFGTPDLYCNVADIAAAT